MSESYIYIYRERDIEIYLSIYISIYLYIERCVSICIYCKYKRTIWLYLYKSSNIYVYTFIFIHVCVYLPRSISYYIMYNAFTGVFGRFLANMGYIYIYIPHWPFLSFTYMIIEGFLVFPPKIPETMLLLCRSVLWDFHWLPQKSPGINETFARANQRVAWIATLLGSEAWQVNLSDPSFLVLGGAVVVFLYIWNETVKCPINILGNSAHNSHNYIVFTQQRGWNCTPNYFWFPSML